MQRFDFVRAILFRCGWGYSNRLIAGGGPLEPNPWYTGRTIGGPQCTQCPGTCPVPRSNSNPGTQVTLRHTLISKSEL